MRLSIIAALCSVALSLAASAIQSTWAQAQSKNTISARVVGGQPTSDIDSSVVKILWRGLDTCTGSVIAPAVVLTAAHCVSDHPGKTVEKARLFKVVSNGKQIGVKRIKVHPRARENSKGFVYYDVALLFLKEQVSVSPIALLLSRGAKKGDSVQVLGYGGSRDGLEGQLHQGPARIDYVDKIFVGLQFGAGESFPCAGDSGGPLLSTYVDGSGVTRTGTVGVTSAVSSYNCTIGDKAIYANTQNPVIYSFISKNVPAVSLQ